MAKEDYPIHIAFKNPDEFEGLLDNDLDISEYTVRDECLVLTLWNGDEVTIPLREVLFYYITQD